MSGNLFSGVLPISDLQWQEAKPNIVDMLEDLGCTDVTPVGSTGLTTMMGDIDLAVRCYAGRNELAKRLEKRFETRKVGKDVVSIKYALPCSKSVQIDIMIGEPRYITWSRSGSTIPGIKGSCRAVFLNFVTKLYSTLYIKQVSDDPLTRDRYVLDFASGLCYVKQTKHGKNGNELKSWKLINSLIVSSDPEFIVCKLFGPYVTYSATLSLPGIISTFKTSRLYKDNVFKNIMLLSYLDEIEGLIKDNPESYGDIEVIKKAVMLYL